MSSAEMNIRQGLAELGLLDGFLEKAKDQGVSLISFLESICTPAKSTPESSAVMYDSALAEEIWKDQMKEARTDIRKHCQHLGEAMREAGLDSFDGEELRAWLRDC